MNSSTRIFFTVLLIATAVISTYRIVQLESGQSSNSVSQTTGTDSDSATSVHPSDSVPGQTSGISLSDATVVSKNLTPQSSGAVAKPTPSVSVTPTVSTKVPTPVTPTPVTPVITPVTPVIPPTPPSITFMLTVAKSGTGTGTVIGGGISCGSVCQGSIAQGTAVTLTALPSGGSVFNGWSGGCTGTGNCVVTMNAVMSVVANFGSAPLPPPPPPPSPSPTPGDSTYTTAGVATHNTQSNCWIIISGKIYNVTSWISSHPGGVNAIVSRCGTDSTTAFSSNANGGHAHSAYAYSLLPSYYVADVTSGTTPTPPPPPPPPPPGSYSVSVSKSGTGSGTVSGSGISCGSTCSTNIVGGSSVTLTASPASGSTFAGWSGACSGTGSCTVTINANTTISASFATTGGGGATTYTVHVTSAGNYDLTNLTLNAGDSINFIYSAPISGEVRTAFTPTGISSVTLDSEYTQRSRTFPSAGTWTFKAQDHNGNTGTVTVH